VTPPLPHEAPENFEAMRRAAAVAQWNLGSPSWAYMILSAYFDPDDADAYEALEELSEEPAAEVKP
jgi:hypothetical protein